jgi:hypothetical protein
MKKRKKFRGPSPDEKTHRFSIELPLSLLKIVDACAKPARRSRAGMCWDLIAEALNARKRVEMEDLQRRDQESASRDVENRNVGSN